jgi:chorismate-pyruvate lyase
LLKNFHEAAFSEKQFIMKLHSIDDVVCKKKKQKRNEIKQELTKRYETKRNKTRQTNCMTRMISRDYHFRYHSAYYIVYHRFLPSPEDIYQTFFD